MLTSSETRATIHPVHKTYEDEIYFCEYKFNSFNHNDD